MRYCGKDCQRLDWPSHKSSCQELKRALQGIVVANTIVSELIISDQHFFQREHLLQYLRVIHTLSQGSL